MYWEWLSWLLSVAPPKGDKVLAVMPYTDTHITGWYTCTYCMDQKKCDLAFDVYNTNFDCLLMK